MVSDPDSAARGQVCSPRANFLRWQTSGGTQGSDDLGRQTGETSVADLVQFGLNLGSGYQAAVFQNSQAVGVSIQLDLLVLYKEGGIDWLVLHQRRLRGLPLILAVAANVILHGDWTRQRGTG